MPFLRKSAFAALWAASGLLPLWLWASPADEPVDYTKETISKDTRGAFEFLGYAFDSKTSRILGPDGAPLTLAGFRDRTAPADFRANRNHSRLQNIDHLV